MAVVLILSGTTYDEAIECSNVPLEERWPVPVFVKWGRGTRVVYTVTAEQAEHIKSHVLDVYECREGYEGAAADRARLRGDLRRWGMIE